jgi:pyruvate dehydrogenase E2 component (dihydrolipoamide acetyltransferase)
MDLQDRANEGKLALEDVKRGTFTITNVGAFPELRWTTPLINQLQCAILGISAIRQAPVVHDGQIVVRWVVSVSLTFDHRIVNGMAASSFLQTFSQLLTEPATMDLGI